MNGIIGKRLRGEFVPADVIHLSRLYLARNSLVDYWLRGKRSIDAPPRAGFMPHIRPVDPPPLEATDAEEVAVAATPARRNIVERLVDTARERGFRLVIVVGPISSSYRALTAAEHLEWLRALESTNPGLVHVWDVRDAAVLEPSHFKDRQHLWDDGARRFSAFLGRRYTESRVSQ